MIMMMKIVITMVVIMMIIMMTAVTITIHSLTKSNGGHQAGTESNCNLMMCNNNFHADGIYVMTMILMIMIMSYATPKSI